MAEVVDGEATVREWHDDDGWGVVVGASFEEACWVHYSAIEMEGFHRLLIGQHVYVEAERFPQDGFSLRAIHVKPH